MHYNKGFAQKSLETHLFFGRIMKEHSFFLELGFTPRDSRYTQKADAFRKEFDRLLWDAIALSNGVISSNVLQSGEVITPYTIDAERASAFYTGIDIPIALTQAEEGLMGNRTYQVNPLLERQVYELNKSYLYYISELIKFKSTILSNVLSCRMYTVNYPLLIDHILREAKLYLSIIKALQNGRTPDIERNYLDQEIFWNRIMAEHSKFIRGLLDPSEDDLLKAANDFGNTFDELTDAAKEAMDRTTNPISLTKETLDATIALRDFKATGTKGLIDCKIKSIIIPLLADHTLREANHYIRLLTSFEDAAGA